MNPLKQLVEETKSGIATVCESGIKGLWSCTNEAYHVDASAVSHSDLEMFRESIPLYHETRITGTIERGAASPGMKLGTTFHALVLQPEAVQLIVAVLPKGHGSSNKVKDTKAMYEAETPQRTIITSDQWDTARRMADAVRENSFARDLLDAPGLIEQSIRIVEPETGLEIKARFDKLFPAGHHFDLKSANAINPEAFGRQAHNFGYHRQTAHYDLVRDLSMGEGIGFCWHLVTSNEEPFETVVYQMDESAKALGAMQNRALLAELKERRESNNWVGRWATKIHPLSLPPWAYRQGDE